jgi:membrane protein YqaA with SNARE-associated domain
MRKHLARALVIVLMLAIIVTLVSITLGRELMAGRQPTLESFSLIHFGGYLFFLVMPVEILVPYYLAEGHQAGVLVFVAIATAMAAQLIDYGIGYLLSDRVINTLVGPKRYARARHAINDYGRWAVLLFTLLPLSSPTLLLAAGIVRFRLGLAVTYSLVGLSGKIIGSSGSGAVILRTGPRHALAARIENRPPRTRATSWLVATPR